MQASTTGHSSFASTQDRQGPNVGVQRSTKFHSAAAASSSEDRNQNFTVPPEAKLLQQRIYALERELREERLRIVKVKEHVAEVRQPAHNCCEVG